MTENKRSKANNEEPTPQPKEEPQQKETHDLFISPEMAEKREAADADVEGDLAEGEMFKTKHTEGHTYDPHQAWEQGLTYTPPTDPPTLPSDDEPQGVEIATGFAQNMEGTDPHVSLTQRLWDLKQSLIESVKSEE